MTDLADLIARAEGATGPDSQLDLFIWRWEHGFDPFRASFSANRDPIFRVTASLDAALALVERVLPGAMWQVGFDPDDGSMCARLVTVPPPCTHAKANHDTAALALILALLRALQAQQAPSTGPASGAGDKPTAKP